MREEMLSEVDDDTKNWEFSLVEISEAMDEMKGEVENEFLDGNSKVLSVYGITIEQYEQVLGDVISYLIAKVELG